MKNNMHKSKKIIYLEKILRFMAKLILKRYKPKIIGITGSVGKSSTKEAVYLALKNDFRVRRNKENYNNEIGIPLTIIGVKTGGRNPLKWFWVFLKWLFRLIMPIGYPKILILEMAVDRPGDMKYLTDFIEPEIGVLTDISASHLEFFRSINQIVQEKSVLIKNISENGMAILNMDNEIIVKLAQKFNGKIVKIGIENKVVDLRASDIHLNYFEDELKGLSFKLNYKGKTIPFRLPNIIAQHQIYAVLIAVAMADYFKINLIEVAKSLEKFKSPVGRMNLLNGINGSKIIDDTYNASLVSTIKALETLQEIKSNRKIVILGDMLELGNDSKRQHQKIIEKTLAENVDMLLVVGKRMKKALEQILGSKELMKNIWSLNNSKEVGRVIKRKLQAGDLVLVKGSQGMRMENVVKEIMSDSKQSKKLLCRQSENWQKIASDKYC